MSAKRAGFDVAAADMFGDADLRSMANVSVVTNYPHGLVEAVKHFAPGPWIYTGALENHPNLVERMSKSRELLGTSADQLPAVRNPALMSRALQEAELPHPANRPADDPPPTNELWLVKPLRSAGGLGICSWSGTLLPETKDYFFQTKIEGTPISAVFVGTSDGVTFLGATEQLIGTEWLHSAGFQYCGSLGPLQLASTTTRQCRRIGETLRRRFGLLGLFGVDAILSDDEVIPVEINPRYPASVEILERCSGCSAVKLHVDACRNAPQIVAPERPTGEKFCGKAIVYAPRDLNVDHSAHLHLWQQRGDPLKPEVADIPMAGTEIPRHRPILTIFAEGPNREHVVAALRSKTKTIVQGFD